MTKTSRITLFVAGGLVLFAGGAAFGFKAGEVTHGLYPTDAYVSELLHECSFSAAVYEHAEASPLARRLLTGSLTNCFAALDAWSGQIGPEHGARVDRIRTAYRQATADQAPRDADRAVPAPTQG